MNFDPDDNNTSFIQFDFAKLHKTSVHDDNDSLQLGTRSPNHDHSHGWEKENKDDWNIPGSA